MTVGAGARRLLRCRAGIASNQARTCQMAIPAGVVAGREVAAEVDAARLLALPGPRRSSAGRPSAGSAAPSRRGRRTRAPGRSGTRTPRRARPPPGRRRSRTMPMLPDHQAAQRVGDVGHVERLRRSSGSNRLLERQRREACRASAAAASAAPAAAQARRRPAPRAGCSTPAGWPRAGRCDVTSPAAHRPGSVVRPCMSTVTPPIM